MSSPHTLPLSDPQAELAVVGGKGASLTRLVNAGLPVPDGFHVTTAAYRRFVDENALQPRILAALEAVDVAQPVTLETASQTIRELFSQAVIPQTVADEIAGAYSELPSPCRRGAGGEVSVAVRSSATAEDLPDLSLAGQQDTYLNILGVDAVLDAVKRCWASLWTARAIGYRMQHAIDQEVVSLAVVVQVLKYRRSAHIETDTVLELYGLDPSTARLQSLEATHQAFHVVARSGEFGLRQYNPYTQPQHLAAQFLLADLLQEMPVQTPPAIRTSNGRRFAEVDGKLWALFPWCRGRPGQHGDSEDHRSLATAAGLWVRGVQKAAEKPQWPEVEEVAALFRQRKAVAWVVPLDRVPEFAREIDAVDRMRRDAPKDAGQFRKAEHDIEICLEQFTTLAEKHGAEYLPRCVTHGDLYPENLIVGPKSLTLIDLDCFTYEPRAGDLARAACRLGGTAMEARLRELLPPFQRTAALSREEIDALPLLMAGYHLYYAIVHGLIFLLESSAEHAGTVERIAAETAMCRQALGRYPRSSRQP